VTSTDADFLAHAVRLALENAVAGAPPFGALVVRDGRLLATGVNTTVRDADPTAHAEVAAMRAACRSLGTLELNDATVYSSCEPCPLCVATATLVGVSRVLYAAPKESAARAGFVLPGPAAELQAVWRSTGTRLEHVPVPGAEEPFTQFVKRAPTG
jgi:tRNA(Arg) A34 adenosine deaminase TadA